MSTIAETSRLLNPTADRGQQRHRLRIHVGAVLMVAGLATLFLYGFDYYALDSLQRPFSAKHQWLRSSGTIGLRLGYLGFLMFLGLYLYPIRKRWQWLLKKGNSRHWLDVHVLLGLSAPCVIAFHSAFRFRGIAGVAFWIMAAVALSGIIGRYLYAQIPRSLTAAELSMNEIQEQQSELHEALALQRVFSPAELQALSRLPTQAEVQAMPAIKALSSMIWLDAARVFRTAALRRRGLSVAQTLATLGGLLASSSHQLEEAIHAARRQAALAKRLLFLNRVHQVFHLWHVVHRPFSYSFSVLSAIHILVVLLFGAR
jgi:hypothetical protein